MESYKEGNTYRVEALRRESSNGELTVIADLTTFFGQPEESGALDLGLSGTSSGAGVAEASNSIVGDEDSASGRVTNLMSASASKTQTRIRFMSFIQQSWVAAPYGICDYGGSNRYFRGDQRQFGPYANNKRTQADLIAFWTHNQTSYVKGVGKTRVYKRRVTAPTYI